MLSPIQRRANNALGICVLSLIALMETVFADLKRPSAASPYVWAVLGTTAFVSLVYWLRHRNRAEDADS
jgi:hypothetical protein